MKNTTSEKLLQFLQEGKKQGTSPFDTQATVQRVEEDTAWVRFPGAEQDTPIRKTINAMPGDNVQVRVGGGDAWLVGNQTAPPTDDKKAIIAEVVAIQAKEAAKKARADIEEQRHYFWHDEQGAHVSTVENDATQGKNILIDSDSMDVRDGETIMASFGAVTQIGEITGSHTIIDVDGQRFYAGDGTTQLANIGYGEGQSESGTATAPFYTFGTRQAGSPVGVFSYVEGRANRASSQYSHAEGFGTEARNSCAHAEGSSTHALGGFSHAEGSMTRAIGLASHAEGESARAEGRASHAEGDYTTASGIYSHAEGSHTTASGDYSHAEGNYTTASGAYSHAEGDHTTASGDYSHASGYRSGAAGICSRAFGYGVGASYDYQTAVGKYNLNDASNAFEIGNGTGSVGRGNALEVTWTGDVTAAGEITDGSGNVLSAKADKVTNVGTWGGSDAIQDQSVPSGTITDLGSISLDPGIYLCIIFASWTANASGRRYLNMAKTAGASSGETRWMADSVAATPAGVTTQRMVFTLSTSTTDTWYINALQNSGSNLTATIRYNFVKIG